jgi:hypothetical protein
MVDQEIYDEIKEALVASERLFSKLHKVGCQYEAIDFDESGLYAEEEEKVIGRWSKLAKKLDDELNETVQNSKIAIKKRLLPDQYQITLQVTSESEPFEIEIDYSKAEELSLQTRA